MENEEKSKPTLLTLPAEIKNKIFSYVVVKPASIGVFFRKSPTTGGLKTVIEPTPPSILNACRALRDEAGSVYYGKNAFEVYLNKKLDGYSVSDFLGCLKCYCGPLFKQITTMTVMFAGYAVEAHAKVRCDWLEVEVKDARWFARPCTCLLETPALAAQFGKFNPAQFGDLYGIYEGDTEDALFDVVQNVIESAAEDLVNFNSKDAVAGACEECRRCSWQWPL